MGRKTLTPVEDLTIIEAAAELAALAAEIAQHDRAYFEHDAPSYRMPPMTRSASGTRRSSSAFRN
jgi:hypothetical protein